MGTVHYALIISNVVAGIETVSPYGRMEPGLTWVEFDPEVVRCEAGYLYNSQTGQFERPRLPLAEEKEELLELLNFQTDEKIDNMLTGFPRNIRLTFFLQYAEAKLYKAGFRSEEDIIFLRTLAARRRVPLDELVERVIKLISQLAVYTAMAEGDRQAFEDDLKAITTYPELDELWGRVEEWGRK